MHISIVWAQCAPCAGERECRAPVVTTLDRFKLAELSVGAFASPDTFRALYDDVIELLETKYEQSAWEVHSQDDVTEDPEHGDALDRLRQEAEVVSRFG